MSNNKKISQLGLAGTLTGTELVPVVKSGATVQTTTQEIADLGASGGSQSLQEVTDNGNTTTNDIIANSFNTPLSFVGITDNGITVINSGGTNPLFVVENATDTVKYAGVEVATINDIPSLAGYEQTSNKSSSYTASSTTTYANTKALVDGLDTTRLSSFFQHASTSLADSTSYFICSLPIAPVTVTSVLRRISAPITGQLREVEFHPQAGGIASSAQDIGFKVNNKTAGTSLAVGNVRYDNSVGSYIFTGFTFAVTQGDTLEVELVVPILTTNPSSCFGAGNLFFK
jgi:hypothetical protein